MRQEGYYWVKCNGVWLVAMWDEDGWRLPGIEFLYEDVDFAIIDERRIQRNEPGKSS